VFQKKGATKLMVVTSSNLNQFAKFFQYWKEKEISNKILVLFLIIPYALPFGIQKFKFLSQIWKKMQIKNVT